MKPSFHGLSCTMIVFESPGGEIAQLILMEGELDDSGEEVFLRTPEGDPVHIPEHLVHAIEPVTDEHRELIEEITSAACLRVNYDGRIDWEQADINALLVACTACIDAAEE